MQIYQCPIEGGNFGDDLNGMLWPLVYPNIKEKHPNEILLGVGTVIGRQFIHSPEQRKVVFGAGTGYKRPLCSMQAGRSASYEDH